jgi:hypothetical protein
LIDIWNPPHDRYQVTHEAAVQKLDGSQDVLPRGFAEVEPLTIGQRVTMSLERVKLDLAAGEVDRLVLAGTMRKL